MLLFPTEKYQRPLEIDSKHMYLYPAFLQKQWLSHPDAPAFGGQGRVDLSISHPAKQVGEAGVPGGLKRYIPVRGAFVSGKRPRIIFYENNQIAAKGQRHARGGIYRVDQPFYHRIVERGAGGDEPGAGIGFYHA